MIDRRRALIGQAKGRLPSEYQEVEWIETDGNSCIETEYDLSSTKRFNFDYVIENYTANKDAYLFCCASGWKNKMNAIQFYRSYRTFIYGNFRSSNYDISAFDNGKHTFAFNPYTNTYTLDELYSYSANAQSFSGATYKLRLFCYSENGTNEFFLDTGFRFIHFAVYNGQTLELELNLVPCIRKTDMEVGVYDLCGSICPLTGTPFYINAGTGEFTAGPAV